MLLGFLVVAKTVVLVAAPLAYKNALQTKMLLDCPGQLPIHAAAQHGWPFLADCRGSSCTVICSCWETMLYLSEALGTLIPVEMLLPMRSQSNHFQLGNSDQAESQSASLTTFGEHLGLFSKCVLSGDACFVAELFPADNMEVCLASGTR